VVTLVGDKKNEVVFEDILDERGADADQEVSVREVARDYREVLAESRGCMASSEERRKEGHDQHLLLKLSFKRLTSATSSYMTSTMNASFHPVSLW
jgi:DhnA family fructose-bisphosphate aldolase class Ia